MTILILDQRSPSEVGRRCCLSFTQTKACANGTDLSVPEPLDRSQQGLKATLLTQCTGSRLSRDTGLSRRPPITRDWQILGPFPFTERSSFLGLKLSVEVAEVARRPRDLHPNPG